MRARTCITIDSEVYKTALEYCSRMDISFSSLVEYSLVKVLSDFLGKATVDLILEHNNNLKKIKKYYEELKKEQRKLESKALTFTDESINESYVGTVEVYSILPEWTTTKRIKKLKRSIYSFIPSTATVILEEVKSNQGITVDNLVKLVRRRVNVTRKHIKRVIKRLHRMGKIKILGDRVYLGDNCEESNNMQ